jgi:hypothetical protein
MWKSQTLLVFDEETKTKSRQKVDQWKNWLDDRNWVNLSTHIHWRLRALHSEGVYTSGRPKPKFKPKPNLS